VWNLDRPAAHRPGPIFSVPVTSGTNTGSSLTSLNNTTGATPSTLPHPFPFSEGTVPTVSQSSSISHVLNAHTRAITDINWSPFHPEILASCGIDAWMWAWDLREPSRPKQGYSAWNAAMTQVKWNRASPHRLATSCDNKVLIWDDRKGALPLATIEAAQSRVYGIDWSRDTSLGLSRLITCSLDGSVKWWDLDSPAAQNAIGERRLVTEEEAIVETHTPVWRARHLPFGNGVMTLPQRGDNGLSMWAKDKPDEPVHRFEGHRDTVKEYLLRTQGGNDRETDDRKFQLITWSKDQTLRLWPISEDMMKAVGHRRDTPIRVLQTRIGADNVTYRVPPEAPTGPITLPPVIVSSDRSIQSPLSSSAGMNMLPPADATRSMLSISAKTSDRTSSRLGTSVVVGSPKSLRETKGEGLQGFSSSFGHERTYSGSHNERNPRHRLSNASHLTINKEKRSATFLSDVSFGSHHRKMGKMTLEPPRESLGFSQERTRRDDNRADRKERHRKRHDIPSNTAAGKNYMTRGTGGHPSQGRFTVGGQLSKGNRGAALDAVGWIAGVRMGVEEKVSETSSAAVDPLRQDGGVVADEEEMHYNAGQVLGEEIKAVSRDVTGVAFEKIDVSTRMCTVTCYGPWAGKSVACFLRISFTFPANYPAKAPKFELEHNASVPLKTRAFLLRKVSSILLEATQIHPPEPSMEKCIRFLQGELLDDEVLGGSSGLLDFWLPGDDSDEEEGRPSLLKMVPRTSGVSFGPDGQLVVFSPSTKIVDAATTPSAAIAAEAGSTNDNGSLAPNSGGARFLHSYTALSGAMNSLARLAKEGMAVQELDVVSLMADQSFFIKRIQKQQNHRTSSQVNSSSKVRERSAANQDRLNYIRSSSRPSSTSRSNRRARSESPMPRSSVHSTARASRIDPHYESAKLEARSNVHIFDLTRIVAPLSVLTPSFARKRSSSMPSTPTSLTPSLTPRQEDTFQLSAVPAVPSQNISHRRIPAMQKDTDDSEDDGSSDDQYGESDSDEEIDATALLRASQRDAMSPSVEQILDTMIWTIPFSFLYLMMDIMIQQQYGINPTFFGEASRLLSPLPILTAFIYFTAIRPFTSNRLTLQAMMFLIGTSCGTCFLYVYSKSAMEMVIRRIPPLAVLWMYSIVRMDLSLLLMSLSIVWGFVIYYDLPVFS
jgi:WD40 repeat protein